MTDLSRYDGRYPEPPYEVGDDATAALAVELTERDEEIERLRGALRYIWDRCGPHVEFAPCADAVERARRALGSSADIIPLKR